MLRFYLFICTEVNRLNLLIKNFIVVKKAIKAIGLIC